MMMGFGLLGLLLMILFWGGLIFVAIWLVKVLFSGNQGAQNTSISNGMSANEILDKRYTRGEITREQYELMKSDLDDTPQLPQG